MTEVIIDTKPVKPVREEIVRATLVLNEQQTKDILGLTGNSPSYVAENVFQTLRKEFLDIGYTAEEISVICANVKVRCGR